MMKEQAVLLKKNETGFVQKMYVFDMDNTLLIGRFVDVCAERFDFKEQLATLRQSEHEPGSLTKKIARLFAGLSLLDLQRAMDTIPVVSDAFDTFKSLKDRGHITGIISDSYQFVVDGMKQRLGADFAVGNTLEVVEGRITGHVTIPHAYHSHPASPCHHAVCKTNVLTHLVSIFNVPLEKCIAIGDSENDLCMIQHSGRGIAFCPTYAGLLPVADEVINDRSFKSLLSL